MFSGVVEEVYAAQRKRDEAMTGRMKLANGERDDVLARLRQIEARLDSQGCECFCHSMQTFRTIILA